MSIKGIIYRIFNTVDDKMYIGSTTKQIHIRMLYHKKVCRDVKKENIPIYVHMRAIGIEYFHIEPVKVVTVDNTKELHNREYTEIRKIDKSKALNLLGYGIDEEKRKLHIKEYIGKNKERKKLLDSKRYCKNKENTEWLEKKKITSSSAIL